MAYKGLHSIYNKHMACTCIHNMYRYTWHIHKNTRTAIDEQLYQTESNYLSSLS